MGEQTSRTPGGFPDADAVRVAYEASDIVRAITCYKHFFPAVSGLAILCGSGAVGIAPNRVLGTMDTRPGQAGLTLRPENAALQLDGMLDVTDQGLAALRSMFKLKGPLEGDSVTLRFGRTPPETDYGTWVQALPGVGWFMYFRVYGPTGAAFDGTRRPGDFELESRD